MVPKGASACGFDPRICEDEAVQLGNCGTGEAQGIRARIGNTKSRRGCYQSSSEKGQEQLAQLVDKKRTYISRIENNASDIRLSTLMRIIKEGLGGSLKLSVDI